MLSLTGVSHRFRRHGKPVLEDIALTVGPGERVAIIGPSGCGKSTLLSIIAGILSPSAGRVELNGQPLASIAPDARRFALVYQSPPRMPGFTVRDLLLRPARREGRSNAERRVESALRAVGLTDKKDDPLDQLSGGEQQRSFLARTLVWKSQLILLDEPFSSVDARTKRSLMLRILEHQAQCEAGLILITHDPREAALIAQRYVLVQEGRIVSEGLMATAASNPSSPFSALVFGAGSINIVPGELDRVDAEARLHCLGSLIPGHFEGTFSGSLVRIAIPSGALQLSRFAGATSMPIDANIRWISAGSGSIAIGDFDFGPLYVADLRGGVLAGSQLTLAVPPEGLVLFDLTTDRRVGRFLPRPGT